jgi:hypothetical protein
MIDAYVIGVRIALEDGVSSGIGPIRDQLTQLNGAIDAAQIRIADFRREGAAATALGLPNRAGESLQATAPERGAGAPLSVGFAAEDSEAMSSGDDQIKVARRRIFNGRNNEALRLSDFVPRLNSAMPEMTPRRERAHAQATPPEERDRAGSASTTGSFAHPMSTMTESYGHSVGPKDRRVVSSAERSAPAGNFPPTAMSVMKYSTESNLMLHGMPAHGEPSAPATRSAVNGRSDKSGLDGASKLAGGSQPALTASAAAGDAAAGPPVRISGDVYLDGNRIGRWIGEQLDRAASRPGIGGSHFDSRQSPSWGGTSLGF